MDVVILASSFISPISFVREIVEMLEADLQKKTMGSRWYGDEIGKYSLFWALK